MKAKKIFLLLSIVILFSCKKEETTTPTFDMGYNYYPLTVGDSAFFKVQQIVWNDFNQTIDTSNYFLCEYIESISQNYAGDSLYRIERFLKTNLNDNWSIDSVWFAVKTNAEGLRIESNRTFSKIVFPIAKKRSWDANAYNTFDEKKSTCVDISSAFVNSINYEKAVYIDLERFSSLINTDVETEIYAYNKGLVQKEKIHLYHPFNPISGAFDIKSGYKYIQTRYYN